MGLLDFLRPQGAQLPGEMSNLVGTGRFMTGNNKAGQPVTGEIMNPGPMSGLARILQPEIALPMAAMLLGNQGNMANFGNALGAAGTGLQAQKAEQKKQAELNKTLEFFKQQAPEYAQMIASGMPVGDAWKTYTEQKYAQQKDPAAVQEYEYAKQQGYGGSFMDFQIDQRKAGASQNNITVGGGKYGTIPQGFELMEGPEGATMRRIPGGPEDTSIKDARQAGQNDVATRVVTSAAQRAREAAKNRQFGGYGQGVMSNVPWTDSAEVARQVDVLKSTAKVENLTAMRAASPTGGALGSVTEKEAEMLAAKSGALDPSSPTFERDLDDYELTLLQVVHGPQEGTRIWQQTRGGGGMPAQQQAPGGNTTRTGVQWSVTP